MNAIIMLQCKCGNELETDYPLETALKYKCGKCGASEWSQKQAKKAIAKDSTAPLELINQKKRKGDDE